MIERTKLQTDSDKVLLMSRRFDFCYHFKMNWTVCTSLYVSFYKAIWCYRSTKYWIWIFCTFMYVISHLRFLWGGTCYIPDKLDNSYCIIPTYNTSLTLSIEIDFITFLWLQNPKRIPKNLRNPRCPSGSPRDTPPPPPGFSPLCIYGSNKKQTSNNLTLCRIAS